MRVYLVAVSLLLASCSNFSMPSISLPDWSFFYPHKIDVQQGNRISIEMREKLKLGMSSAMVRSILGTPLVNDPFHAKRWDYVYRFETEGKLVEQQRLTLYFENDHLARIDDSHMPPLPPPPPAPPAPAPVAEPEAAPPVAASAVLASPEVAPLAVPASAVAPSAMPQQGAKK